MTSNHSKIIQVEYLFSPVVPGAVVAVASEVVEAVVPRRPPLEHSGYGSVASATWNKERKKPELG